MASENRLDVLRSRELDLDGHRSEVRVRIAPNGTGETETLRMGTGLLALNAGRIDVVGIDLMYDRTGLFLERA